MTPESRRVASAVAGEAGALGDLAHADAEGEIGRAHRTSGALYLGATAQGTSGPALSAWRRDMIVMSARHLVLAQAVERCGEVLSAAGVSWIPFKGYDLATRAYAQVEERVTSDLDLLISPADLERARTALIEAGWDEVFSGPRARRYLAEEGYAWQGVGQGVLLELHYRLWGSVAEGFAAEMVAAASPDPDLPAGGHRLTAAHAYVAAAVHSWLSDPPRGVGIWRDLERLVAVGPASLVDEVVDFARRRDVQLPVALASEVASRLWRVETCARIAADLEGDLRAPERLARTVALKRGAERASLGVLTAGRLAAGRRMRLRGKIVWRRLWDHAGVVEVATPEQRPWISRRLSYQLSALGLRRVVARRPRVDS
ncbi:MAG: nucleotidyltransferase family protein [bacterium]|nr:nucleotidyltransferase family protein [bacterium]